MTADLKAGIAGHLTAFLDNLDTQRARIRELRDEAALLDGAPVPEKVMKARIAAWVGQQAARFQPTAGGLIFHDRSGGAHPHIIPPPEGIRDPALAIVQMHAAYVAALCALAPAQIVKALEKSAAETLEQLPVPPMTAEALEQRRGEIAAELRRLEIEEERAIRDAEAAGVPLDRRDDADPAILLLDDAALAAAGDQAKE